MFDAQSAVAHGNGPGGCSIAPSFGLTLYRVQPRVSCSNSHRAARSPTLSARTFPLTGAMRHAPKTLVHQIASQQDARRTHYSNSC
jgi:hypothetical protein